MFESCPRRPEYFFNQDRGGNRKNRQVIMSRCISTRTPTRPDKPHDEAEEDGEDGLKVLLQALKEPVVWLAEPLATASSIANFANTNE